jgi:hypothetical protein
MIKYNNKNKYQNLINEKQFKNIIAGNFKK